MTDDLWDDPEIEDDEWLEDSDKEVTPYADKRTAEKRKSEQINITDLLSSDRKARLRKKYGTTLDCQPKMRPGTAEDTKTKNDSDDRVEEIFGQEEYTERRRLDSDGNKRKTNKKEGDFGEKRIQLASVERQHLQLAARVRARMEDATYISSSSSSEEEDEEEGNTPQRQQNQWILHRGRKEKDGGGDDNNNSGTCNDDQVLETNEVPTGLTPPPSSNSSNIIELKVRDSNGHEILIQYKSNKTFAKLFGAVYAWAKEWLPSKTARMKLSFDGDAVRESDTPQELGMESGDFIDLVYIE